MIEQRQKRQTAKQIHGRFVRQAAEIASKEMPTQLEREVEKQTEDLIVAAQD